MMKGNGSPNPLLPEPSRERERERMPVKRLRLVGHTLITVFLYEFRWFFFFFFFMLVEQMFLDQQVKRVERCSL